MAKRSLSKRKHGFPDRDAFHCKVCHHEIVGLVPDVLGTIRCPWCKGVISYGPREIEQAFAEANKAGWMEQTAGTPLGEWPWLLQ